MSIYISYHPLDYDFAYELLIYTRNLGLKTKLYAPHIDDLVAQQYTNKDKIVVVLRPEYLHTPDYSAVVNLLEIISDIIPVLRVPISIDEWSANTVLRPIADFSRHNKLSMELNLQLLRSALLMGEDESLITVLTPKEIYLNNLDIVLRAYIRPITSLEHVNYASDPTNELPISRLLRNSQFKVGILNKKAKWRSGYRWHRKDSLENIVAYYKSFVLTCHDIDHSAIAYYLVDMARRHAEVDLNAPVPIFLDVESWPIDIPWADWLLSQATFSDTLIEDIASGKCAIYAYGLDHTSFKAHPLKDSFEEWLYGNSPPRHFIIICPYLSHLDDYLLTDIVVEPIEYTFQQYQEIFVEYKDRPFGQFIVKSTRDNAKSAQVINYLLQNPVLVVTLLSVNFENGTNFEQFGVSEYYQILIKNLWQIATFRDPEGISDFTEVENLLVRLATTATEEQRANINYTKILSLSAAETAVMQCVDTDFLLMRDNMIRFSMPIIQEYFAAKWLVQFGISPQLPHLALDESYCRIPQRWDKPIIIYSHLSDSKDDILRDIAEYDPLLALLSLVSGVRISPQTYTLLIEKTLNLLITLGDFRIDFARLLYRIDPYAAKAIFVEIMRDAQWSIRVNAFGAFTDLETSFLPGLAEAITDITDATRNYLVQAIQRLGTDALSTLFKLLLKDNSNTRRNAAWALGKLGDKTSVPALVEALHDNDLSVSNQVILSLDLLQDINCVPYLVHYLHSRHTGLQKTIGTALGHLQRNMPEQFVSHIQKLDATDKISVIHTLHGHATDNLIDFLLKVSYDENADVRLAAINELIAHPEARVISRLEDCLGDMTKSRSSKLTVSEIVSKVLSNIQKPESKAALHVNHDDKKAIGNAKASRSSDIVKSRLLQVKETRVKEQNSSYETTTNLGAKIEEVATFHDNSDSTITDDLYVTTILEQLKERTWVSSSNAAKILREYIKGLNGNTSLNAINQILETLNNADWVIRWTGVETLGWTGNVHVVPHLVQRLSDNNWKIRIAAIRSLSEIGDNTAILGLSTLLTDSNPMVREAAAEALGFLDGKQAMHGLESAARDPEEFVRLAAVESLGRIRQKAAVTVLLSALKDTSEHVRWAAANGLSHIVDTEMVSSLLPSLTDTSGPYWEQRRICDVIVDILKQIGSDEALKAVMDWGNSQV